MVGSVVKSDVRATALSERVSSYNPNPARGCFSTLVVSYLDEHVLVDDSAVEHFLRQVAHQRVELVRVLRLAQTTKITRAVASAVFTSPRRSIYTEPENRFSRRNQTAATASMVQDYQTVRYHVRV